MWHQFVFAALVLGAASAAHGKQPEAVSDRSGELAECRAISQDAQRLDCYDRLVDNLPKVAERVSNGEERQAGRAASKSASNDNPNPDVAVAITGVELFPSLQFALISLENGQVWRTTSNGTLLHRFRVGQSVTIARGAFSGYRMRIEGLKGYQAVRRER